MSKWQQTLKNLAEAGDAAASDILWDIRGMNESELAKYLVDNDEHVREVLGIKYLAEEGADPTLNKEYYDLLNKGQMAFQGEGRFDPYGQKPRTVEDYMEKFGVEKGPGRYSDNQIAAFTNPENDKYFMKLKSPEQLQQIASWLDMGNADRLVEDMRRAGDSWQRRNQLEGYDADNGVMPVDWALSALKGFTLPRVKEAQLEGRPVEWQDLTGDMVELGLNFVPGVGIVSKTGKVVATLPKVPGAILKTGAYGADVFAVPFGSQAYDVGVNRLTDRDVPRKDWDWKRMGAQAAMMGTGKATLKSTARMGKDIMEGSLGEKAGTAEYKSGKGFIESIGEKTDDLINRRQAMLDRKAELAREAKNVTREGSKDVKSVRGETVTPQDLVEADNYRILNEEARRLSRSDAERKAYNEAAVRQEASEQVYRPEFSRDEFGNTVRTTNEPAITMDENGRVVISAPEGAGYNNATAALGAEGKTYRAEDKAVADAYRAANEAGAKEIVQLPDGRFVYQKRVKDYELDFGQNYPYPKPDLKSVEFAYEPFLEPTGYTAPGLAFTEGVVTQNVARNPAVKAAIDRDELLSRKLAGNTNYANEVARDVAASVLFTGAAHNDLFGNLGGLESKRADAWWNAQMKKLGELTKSGYDPKTRQQNFDAIMDAMTYGLNNVPVDKFQKRPEAYHAIAAKLGYPEWKHPSEMRDSFSSASASGESSSSMAP